MMGIGTTELIVVLAIVLIIFGPGKLPAVGRWLGRGLGEFKRGVTDETSSENDEPQPAAEKKEIES